MNTLERVTINNYEGPLDLLIHLIHKNEMDIFDVPISEITNHFVEEVRRMQTLDMEIAADFIQMASYLIYLKSRSLLPREILNEDEIDVEQEKINFAKALADLAFCKELALFLRECAESSGKYLYRRDSILLPRDTILQDVYQLTDAFFTITAEQIEEKVVVHSMKERADTVASQTEKIILKKDETLWSELANVFSERFERAIAFSTILTMSKNNVIYSIQDRNFADILMRRLSE